MKTKSLLLSIILIFTIGSLYSCAKDPKSTDTFVNPETLSRSELIQKAYDLTVFNELIPRINAERSVLINRFKGDLPPKLVQECNQKLDKVFDPTLLEERIKKNIDIRFNNESIIRVLKWNNTPLVKKANSLIKKMQTPEENKKKRLFVKKNNIEDIPKKRIRIIENIVYSLDDADLLAYLSFFVEATVLDALNDINPKTPSFTKEQLLKFIYEGRSRIIEKFRRQSLLYKAYIFKSLSDEELSEYSHSLPKGFFFNFEMKKILFRSIYLKRDLIKELFYPY